jgi:hypothetical protein
MTHAERQAERAAAQADFDGVTNFVVDQSHSDLNEWLGKVHSSISDCRLGSHAALDLILELIHDNSEVLRQEILRVLREAR